MSSQLYTNTKCDQLMVENFANEYRPIVVQEFHPATGWQDAKAKRGSWKRINQAWARKLKREGVTMVSLEGSNPRQDFHKPRQADFHITELA
jgi:hypothetical protein